MTSSITNQWTNLAQVFTSTSAELRPFLSSALPDIDMRSGYAVDLALVCGNLLDLESFSIKGHSRFKENKKWNTLRPPLLFAISLAQLTLLSENGQILSKSNSEHLVRQLNLILPDLGSMILTTGNSPLPDGYSPSWVVARSVRLIDQAVAKCGMSYRRGNELERMTLLMTAFAGVFARLKYVASTNSNSASSDFINVLRPTNAEHQDENTTQIESNNTRPATENEAALGENETGTLVARSERDNYDEWVSYCKKIGQLQRMPERLYLDLIPPIEVADHLTKSLDNWENFLEKTMPGRRKWLLDEGVTRQDFSNYWSQPAWVLEFIEKLMDRNLQLEFQGHLEMGEEREYAQLSALAFIPRFSTLPPDDLSLPFRGLPFELFERIRHHLAAVDNDAFQAEMISNDCFFVNDYVRRRIAAGKL